MLKIPSGKVCSFDVESTGLFWRHGDQFYCISFCNMEGESAVVSFPVDPFTRKVTYRQEDLDVIREWAADSAITKVAHNAQFDVGFLKSIGIEVRGQMICTLNLIRLHRSSEKLALKPFCEKYFDIKNEDEEDVKEETRKQRRIGRQKGWKIYEGGGNEEGLLAPDYWLAGKKYFEPYCLLDSARAMMIYKHLMPTVNKELFQMELETWKVLRKIENRGIRVFKEKVLNNKLALKKKRHLYLQKLYRLCGWINHNSPKQLCNLFYDKFKLPQMFLTKKGNPSTDISALQAFKHPAAKLILNVRACEKTIQFMDQYLQHMVKNGDGCWYIHPTFHQAIASTGRESSSNPNMQQVASGERDTGVEVRVEARSVFGPRPNYQMRSYDYKGQEVYIPAYKAGDKKLIGILSSGGDVHENTSQSLTQTVGVRISRYDAKRVYFGLQYGIGITKLARTLGVEKETAAHVIYGFKNEYPELWQWMESMKVFVRRHGYIETAYGRRIHVPREEEYKGVNYYVQGTAGGILKSAKIKISNKLEFRKAYIVLPIHDEVLVEAHTEENISVLDRVIVDAMQDNPELQMPVKIPVSVNAIGTNWAEKKKVGVF